MRHSRRSQLKPLGLGATLLFGTTTLGCGSEIYIATGEPSTSGSVAHSSSSGGPALPPPCEEGIGAWNHEESIPAHARDVSNLVRSADGRFHAIATGQYISGRAGAWTVEKMPHSSACAVPTLAIDDDGHAHVACGMYHWMYKTEYWTNATGRWLKTNLPPGGDGGPATLALAPDGTPHVVYLSYPSGHYFHAVANGEGWTITQLPDPPAHENLPAIAFDPKGQLWIAFMHDLPGDSRALSLGRLDQAGQWTRVEFEKHDHAAFVGGIAVDDHGTIHVTYTGEYTNLYHGRLENGVWTTRLLNDGSALTGKHVSPQLALDADGFPSIGLTRSGDHTAVYLKENDDGWTSTAVGTPRRSLTALALDEVDAAHLLSIEFRENDTNRLLYNTNRRHCPLE